MAYRNARDILPPELLALVQNYAEGELVYIPASGNEKSGWGERNGTKQRYEQRNREIRALAEASFSCDEIAEKYYLTKDSIRKILRSGSGTA